MIDPMSLLQYAPYVIGGATALGGLRMLMSEPDYKDGWLTADGARRHGLTGGKIPLGTMGGFDRTTITAPKESMIFNIGPTGYGKTLNFIENIIFSEDGNSRVIFDLKGDLFEATAAASAKRGQVYVLNPSGGPTNFYNPYVDVAEGDVNTITNVHGWMMPAVGAHPFYTPIGAKLFSAAASHILHCAGYEKTMPGMYDLLTTDNWIQILLDSPVAGVQQIARGISSVSKDMTGSILGLLGWLDHTRVRHIMSKSDFRMADLQDPAIPPSTVYIMLPEASRIPLMPFARIVIGMLTLALMKKKAYGGEARGLTIIIDEAERLALPNIEVFYSASRSFGGRVVLASQILSEIRKLYGPVVEVNSTTQLFTRNQSVAESKHIADTLPKHRVFQRSVTESYGRGRRSSSVRVEEVEKPLMTPSDVMRIPKHKRLVGVVEGHPVRLDTIYSPRAYADIRGKPFTVAEYQEIEHPWAGSQLTVPTAVRTRKPRDKQVFVK